MDGQSIADADVEFAKECILGQDQQGKAADHSL